MVSYNIRETILHNQNAARCLVDYATLKISFYFLIIIKHCTLTEQVDLKLSLHLLSDMDAKDFLAL